MVQKITASLLIALMVLITMTRYQGVNYCLSQKDFFLFDCPASDSTSKVDSCEHCASCGDNIGEPKINKISALDCCLELSLDSDNNWLEAENIRISEFKLNQPNLVWYDDMTLKLVNVHSSFGARGPPSYLLQSPSVPLYIRHSIFLI